MATKFGGNQGTVVLGTENNDLLRGRGGDDIVRGLGGNDNLYGGNGKDRVFGGDGDDTVRGGSGPDFLSGGAGRDKLWGNTGNDTLNGGSGKDRLVGGGGDDTLQGDSTNGGKYADVFVFHKDSGKDVVVDFDVDRDVLQISKGLNKINSAADVIKKSTQVGDDVVINLGEGNKITLKDVKLSDLKQKPGDHFDVF
ncbi:calcium-binding protein [Rhizobium sp. TRM95796]|uniref:calcium-binding protein n=1 Tax=Rhizobium sp. TRM95796 TaxID=2979862 RepID=UPI0021E718F7|nr:calcium-binding protein [Rhizobium sp. TRM95796]MCV3769065.1 calcium-binding protein [Rhizobium sp. TRM95796]